MINRLLFIFPLLLIIACGGGSLGTGSSEGTTISGEVRDFKGNPVANATIIVVGTGETAKTDSAGKFVIQSEDSNTDIEIEVQSSLGTDKITVTPDKESGGVQIDLQIDNSGQVVDVEKLEVSAGIYGRCDKAFLNNRIITQSNRLAENTLCTVKVTIKGDSHPLDDIPFILEARGCAGIHPWKTESFGYTRESGIGQLQFKFKSDAAHCEYRIIAPYKVNGLEPVIYSIYPFTKQEYDEKHKK